ncbi:TetR family transcriptional regulator [Sphaerisporangium sp. NPDC051017]|uniref:TetR family transcriptional regulator n=1 Tax=Sphaerisporangium sp. NPDC051017 TaxID=3154636 RepID=UPI00343ED304
MPPRDAEATRRRLLDAALREFAEFGIAGARVDRIAEAAGSNKAQIYHYFGSKDQLFDAAFETIVRDTVADTPIDVHDLPGYAARLARRYEEHPQVMRLATWQRLERAADAPVPLAVKSVRDKVDAIARAQDEGVLPRHYPPGVLLTLVLQLAAVWTAVNPEFGAAVDMEGVRREDVVADSVRRLLAG